MWCLFVCFFFFTGRLSGKLPVLNLLTGQKSKFVAAIHVKTWQDRRAPGSAWLCKISQVVGMRPRKYQKFPHFGKESPRRGDSLDRFRKFVGAFIHVAILHYRFKFILFVGHALSPEHRSFEGCLVRTSIALPFIDRFRRGFQ